MKGYHRGHKLYSALFNVTTGLQNLYDVSDIGMCDDLEYWFVRKTRNEVSSTDGYVPSTQHRYYYLYLW